MGSVLRQIQSGEWKANAHLGDYRSQLLDKMFVERATWQANAPIKTIGETVIAAPGYIWLRFWLLEGEEPIEKYFDDQRNLVGLYLPICMPVQRRGNGFFAQSLLLALWLEANDRLTVIGEEAFDAAAASHELAPIEVEHAEYRIRTLTFEIHQKRFPPGLVRTFALADEYQG